MSPQRPLSAIVESTARFLEETAPAFPPPPDDVPLEEISNLSLVGLRIALSIGPLGERERALMARVDAEIARRHAPAIDEELVDEELVDEELVADLVTLEAGAIAVPQVAPARLELPLTHSLRLVARPFSTLARRHYRLFGATWRGYNAFLSAWPYYHQRRREPVIWCAALTRAHRRRCERARARRAALTVTRLPPMLYGQGKVA